MNKEELEAAQKLIDEPITAENVDEPIVAFFPTAESRPSELGSHGEANLPRDAAGTRPEDSSTSQDGQIDAARRIANEIWPQIPHYGGSGDQLDLAGLAAIIRKELPRE